MSRILRISVVFLLFACCVVGLPSRALRAQTEPPLSADGTIVGKVIDKSTGDPIIEAGVEVVGKGKKARTDLDGKYSIKIPPGNFELRVFAPLYQGTRLQNVVVESGKVARGDAALVPQGQAAVEVVEVVAKANHAAEAIQLVERKNAAVVSDNISAETISKSADSNAGEIVTRIPAVTIKDNKFIIVRGLNERYTSALLDGSRLPSTDPEKRIVPLDLFPAEFIESIQLAKTYSPDLPGDFAGGLANIRLKDFPDKLSYSVGFSTSYNTDTTFKTFNTYKGANVAKENLGLGANYRRLPDGIPDSIVAAPPAQREAFGGMFRDIWAIDRTTAPPNFGTNFSIGDSFGPFGVALSGLWSTEYKTHNQEVIRQLLNSGTIEQPSIRISDDFVYDRDIFETRLGSVLTSAYQPTERHRFSFHALVNHGTRDEVDLGRGTVENSPGGPRQASLLQYQENLLGYGQLAGQDKWDAIEVAWRSAYSISTMDQPDSRIDTRLGIDQSPFGSYSNDGSGGTRFFADLKERLTDSAVDFTVPFKTWLPFTDVWNDLPAKFKFGPAYAYRDRDFSLRRFQFQVKDNTLIAPGLLDQPTDVVLQPQNIGVGKGIDLKEETVPGDSFRATHEIAAGYGMFELPIFKGIQTDNGLTHQVKVNGGARLESSYIALNTADTNGNPARIIKNTLDPLPAVNLVYSPREDMNVRFGFSEVVTRPEFRELSPVIYPTARGLRPKQGNPFLVQAEINSYDLRWEWFLKGDEILSFSLFYKTLQNPIEQTVIPSSSNNVDSFANADSGHLEGFEFEFRKRLDVISPRLIDFNILTNVSYVESKVTVPRGRLQIQTDTERALQGQSPFIVNAALDYTTDIVGSLRLLYNTADRRIDRVGAYGLPNIYEERRDSLDFVWLRKFNAFGTPLNGKVAVENILNDAYRFTEGDVLQNRYRTGAKFIFSVAYAY